MKEAAGQNHQPREKKALIMKLKLMVATVKTSRKTKTNVGSLWVSTAPLGLTYNSRGGLVKLLHSDLIHSDAG